MQFSNEVEACLALVSVVLSADKVGTSPERTYLFDRVGSMEPFKDLGPVQFKTVVEKVTAQLFTTEDAFERLIHPEGVESLCKAVRAALPENRYSMAFQLACEMACVDGLLVVERDLLDVLGRGLGMTKEDINTYLISSQVQLQ